MILALQAAKAGSTRSNASSALKHDQVELLGGEIVVDDCRRQPGNMLDQLVLGVGVEPSPSVVRRCTSRRSGAAAGPGNCRGSCPRSQSRNSAARSSRSVSSSAARSASEPGSPDVQTGVGVCA